MRLRNGQLATGFLALVFAVAPSVAPAQVDAETIIQKSVAANEMDWNAAPHYNHLERDRGDGDSFKTYEVQMILGSPYQKLIAVDGKPLSAAQQALEEQKLQQTIATRRNETPQQRNQRLAKYEKDRRRDHMLLDQMTRAFNFKLVGEQQFEGRDVYVLNATPRPGYRPPAMETQVLTGMEGKLWIDKNTYQWVKVEAHVIHPVAIEGFLARVQPGTRFELEKAPVADGIWLPTHFAMKAQAKVLFVFNHKSADDETYWGYQKAEPVQTARGSVPR